MNQKLSHSESQTSVMDLRPVELAGRIVRLEPLRLEHVPALAGAGCHEELWHWTPMRILAEPDMKSFVETALDWEAAGTALPFVTRSIRTGEVIGSTRFANVDVANRRVEIGWTWVTPAWQRTGANVEAKYLMLTHAFETLNCIRVEFKTDVLNQQSRRALAGIGAVEEGVLRNHMVVWNGRLRDSVYFSVLPSEWPAVRGRLERKLADHLP
jgi:RimJ/RimL family protein N-acetyltransferase